LLFGTTQFLKVEPQSPFSIRGNYVNAMSSLIISTILKMIHAITNPKAIIRNETNKQWFKKKLQHNIHPNKIVEFQLHKRGCNNTSPDHIFGINLILNKCQKYTTFYEKPHMHLIHVILTTTVIT